jgi:uncharacterized membrane protein
LVAAKTYKMIAPLVAPVVMLVKVIEFAAQVSVFLHLQILTIAEPAATNALLVKLAAMDTARICKLMLSIVEPVVMLVPPKRIVTVANVTVSPI